MLLTVARHGELAMRIFYGSHASCGNNCATRGLVKHRLVTLILIIAGFLVFVGSANAEVSATLNSSNVTTEQSVQLRIVASLPGAAQSAQSAQLKAMSPDFTVLEQDFEILGRSAETKVKVVGAQRQQAQSWTLELLPRRAGDLVVPSFTVNGEATQPINLSVTQPQPVVEGANFGDFHVEAFVDNERPFVQSQVILTIRVYFAINLLEGSLTSPESTDLTAHPLGEDRQFLEKRGDRQYRVLERKIALFPQKSGKIDIQPIQLNGAVPADSGRIQGFFSPRRKIQKQSKPLLIDVLPRPEHYGAAWWLPAKNVSLNGRWEGDIKNLYVGESLTRSLTIIAEGTDSTQLPAIPVPDPSGFRVYADQPELNSQPTASGLRSLRSEKWAIVAQVPGPLTLPEIRIPWFNTETGKVETAVLKETTVEVLPESERSVGESNQSTTTSNQSQSESEGKASASPSASDANDMIAIVPELSDGNDARENSLINFWKRLAFAGLAAWLITLGILAWMYFRRRALGAWREPENTANRQLPPIESSKALLKTIKRACSEQDLRLCATTTLQWAEQQFPDIPPRTLVELARQVPSIELRNQLNALDAAIYSGQPARLALDGFPDLLGMSVTARMDSTAGQKKSALPAL